MTLDIFNPTLAAQTVTITNNYTGTVTQHKVKAESTFTEVVTLATSFAWYDLVITTSSDASFVRHYAGHVETGKDSMSDPAIGAA